MKCKGLVATLSSLVFLAACGSQEVTSQEPTFDEASILAEIDQARDTFAAAVATGDMAALGSLIFADTIMVQPGSTDWRAMQAAAQGAPFAPGAQIEITPIETVVLNKEWAYDFGTSLITYPNPANAEPIEIRDTYLIILRNRGDGWKPFREVASANPPPQGWQGND